MPIYKRCPHCGKRMPAGDFKCGCGYKREYSKPEGTRALYHSKRWQKLRDSILKLYSGIDPLAKSKGRIEPASIVHHIIPAEENPKLFWTPSNLIPLSRASHDEVHVAYRASEESKQTMQALLRSLQKNIE